MKTIMFAAVAALVLSVSMPAEAKFVKGHAPVAAGFKMPKTISPAKPKVSLAVGNSLGVTDPYQFVPLPQSPKSKKKAG